MVFNDVHKLENHKMASGTFKLNSRFFTRDKLKTNPHRLSLNEQVSRPTILRYLNEENIDISLAMYFMQF
jgi:hypothetical protein